MIQNEDKDRHSKYYKRACAFYRAKLLRCAEYDQEFVVDNSWFDELSLVDAHEMVQNNYSQIVNIRRRYESQRESSPMREMENFTHYLTEKIMKIPSCFQQMTIRNNYCMTPYNCCRTNSNVMYESHNELRYSQPSKRLRGSNKVPFESEGEH